jgi:hypothetical protein
MKTSKFIRYARDNHLQLSRRRFLSSNTSEYICFALHNAAEKLGLVDHLKQSSEVREVIMTRLEGFGDLYDWLRWEQRIDHEKLDNWSKLQRTRYNWMTSLADEYAAKKD